MDLGVGAVAGILGFGMGAFATDFALSVPPRDRLPRPTLRPFADRQRTRLTLVGAAVSGVASMILGAVLGLSCLMPVFGLCGLLGIGLAIVDVRVRRLPFAMTGVMYAACAVTFVICSAARGDASQLVRAIVAAVLAFVGFLVLALAFPGQLALGDVVLVGWVAFSLGWFTWRAVAVGLLAGLVVQAVVGLLVWVCSGPRRTLPMGPALLLGWLVGIVITAR